MAQTKTKYAVSFVHPLRSLLMADHLYEGGPTEHISTDDA